MAGPEDWGAVLDEEKPSSPTDWGAVPDEQQPQQGGPTFNERFASEQEPLNMKGFKQRLSDLWERGKVDPETAMASSPEMRMAEGVGKRFVEGFKTGFGEDEIGLSEDQIKQIKDLGLGPGGSAAYAYLAQQFKYGAVLFRGINAMFTGAQEASIGFGVPSDVAHIPDALMGSPHPTGIPKPGEAPASIARVVTDQNGTPRVQHVGDLPTQGDFKAGGDVLARPEPAAPPRAAPTLVEKNLREMWDERGIHPAEVVHDAQNDALLRHDVAPPSIDGWHASPHEFEEFDSSKIGTGQGAQVFGHGIYISESTDVHAEYMKEFQPKAVSYRVRILADREHMIDWDRPLNEQSPYVLQAFERLRDAIKSENKLAQSGLMLDGLLGDQNKAIQLVLDAAKELKKQLKEGGPDEGSFGFRSAGAISKKKLEQRIAEAEAKATSLPFDDFYRQFAKYDFDEISAADMMRDAGIPGIKYLDAGSRGTVVGGKIDLAGAQGLIKTQQAYIESTENLMRQSPNAAQRERFQNSIDEAKQKISDLEDKIKQADIDVKSGTRNFVVFDDKLLEITEKNGVPLKPTKTVPVQNTPMPQGTPRSELARTGEPHIDAILDDPITKRNIDNPVINDQYDVPYSAGGSVPLHDPTMFIDRHFPRSMEVDGVRFDPAEPFTIHENVEQHVMEALIKGGMDKQTAYKVAHFEFAEKAEGAWYRAHGIDQAKAEEAYRPYIDAIQHEKILNNKPERIVGAVVVGKDGKVFYGTGKTHLSAENAASDYYKVPSAAQADLLTDFDGHLTTSGRLVSREEALQIVDRAKQELQYTEPGQTRLRGEQLIDNRGWSTIAEERKHAIAIAEGRAKPEETFNPPPNLYVDPYPHDDVRAAKGEPLAEPGPTKAEIARAKEILAQEPKPGSLGADVTRDMPDTPLSVEPLPAAGSVVAAGREAMSKLFNIVNNLHGGLDPMATNLGVNEALHRGAMQITKDAMNSIARIDFNHLRTDKEIVRRFDAESQKVQWDRLDEQSVMEQEGKISPHMGLATLEPTERSFVETLMDQSKAAWAHALDVEIVKGDGLPSYAPRMMLNIAIAGESGKMSPRALNALGRDVFTKTSQMLHRGYLTAEETEAAGKRLVGQRMAEAGASMAEIEAAMEQVKIARTIRALPLATARLEKAAIWKQMINDLKDLAKATGSESGDFTIAGHPAFTEWGPMRDPAIKGKWVPLRDSAGDIVFEPKQINLPNEFKGPLQAIFGKTPESAWYGIPMAIKGKAMQLILNSPLLHNAVVLSKVIEAGMHWGNPAEGLTFYWKGNRIANEGLGETMGPPVRANELIEAGLRPIGNRGSIQDITGMAEQPNLAVGFQPSITGKVVSALPKVVDQWTGTKAGPKVEATIAKLGDFVHNDLLWNRVRDLQFGLADYLSDKFMSSHGLDRRSADIVASHMSNIIVGSLPKEMMSGAATAIANFAMFSRSYTLGGYAVYKQAIVGLPKPLEAQLAKHIETIKHDMGEMTPEGIQKLEAEMAGGPPLPFIGSGKSFSRRKAIAILALSYGMFKIGNALIQSGINLATKRNDVDQELKGYLRRLDDFMRESGEEPLKLFNILGRLSPTWDNEPSKKDRLFLGNDGNQRGIYLRNPFGKYGEEVEAPITGPLSTVLAKRNPSLAGLMDVLANDKGFGQHIYDEFEGKESIPGLFGIARDVANHLFMKHMPEQQLRGAFDMLHGEGDPTINAWRTFGPVVGLTASEGAPGGPAQAEAFDIKNRFDRRMWLAWPRIKEQIQRGDVDGARARMDQLGANPRMQQGLIRYATEPGMQLRGRTLLNILHEATPEGRGRLERALGNRGAAPVPPEMPQIETPQ